MTQTFPSGQSVTVPVTGLLYGTLRKPGLGQPVAMSIWGSTVHIRYRRTTPLCVGGFPAGAFVQMLPVASDVPSTLTYAASGDVTFAWSPAQSLVPFTSCSPVTKDPATAFAGVPRTVTLNGKVEPYRSGLNRLVPTGGSTLQWGGSNA